MAKRVLLVSDNAKLAREFVDIVRKNCADELSHLAICYSFNNSNFSTAGLEEFSPSAINIKAEVDRIIGNYDLVFSIHCKQVFPKRLVDAVCCINVHPGLNPYNRGWFPQVFSIINGLPLGATIHLMDEKVDHGQIVAQKAVELDRADTSYSAYEKILEAERQLLDENIARILVGDLQLKMPNGEGNYNSRSDFADLCKLDLTQTDTLGNHIDLLRALSHKGFKNAFFIDENTGQKIFVTIKLTSDDGA
jgi:methionyl-tRNA formyltransferase